MNFNFVIPCTYTTLGTSPRGFSGSSSNSCYDVVIGYIHPYRWLRVCVVYSPKDGFEGTENSPNMSVILRVDINLFRKQRVITIFSLRDWLRFTACEPGPNKRQVLGADGQHA